MTLGGRYGLLPIAKDLLSENAVILLDDAERLDEQLLIERWKRNFGIQCEDNLTHNGTYAELRLGKCARPPQR
jgi:hypothetical protein